MAESKRFERDPAEGSRSTTDKQLRDRQREEDENHQTSRMSDKGVRPQGRPDKTLKPGKGSD